MAASSGVDWLVLAATLLGISAYGTFRARSPRSLDHFIRGDESIRWPAIGLSVMATQASAITFLSTPGQAYDDGLRFIQLAPARSDAHHLRASKVFTAGFGLLAIAFAAGAQLIDNLIEAVNLLGSLFYGTLLGIFVVAFYAPKVRGTPVFRASIAAEVIVFGAFAATDLGFLWFNVIGCAVVVSLSLAFERLAPRGIPRRQ